MPHVTLFSSFIISISMCKTPQWTKGFFFYHPSLGPGKRGLSFEALEQLE